jgi:hypothetical protein
VENATIVEMKFPHKNIPQDGFTSFDEFLQWVDLGVVGLELNRDCLPLEEIIIRYEYSSLNNLIQSSKDSGLNVLAQTPISPATKSISQTPATPISPAAIQHPTSLDTEILIPPRHTSSKPSKSNCNT